ncbi:hypothetical protein FACS1894211_09650 [Clostridia bacterium]|nr:hypothetical protein FACS1894211_09650 [Clostridia bacterium]
MIEAFSKWVMSIAGAAALGVFVDLFVPEGKTQKVVRGVFGIVTVLAVVLPLPGLLKRDYSAELGSGDQTVAVSLDQTYLYAYYREKAAIIERGTEKHLAASGYGGAAVTLATDGYREDMNIVGVYMNLAGTTSPAGKSREQVYSDVKELAARYLNVGIEKLIAYG